MTLISTYLKTANEGMKKMRSRMSISSIMEIITSFTFNGSKLLIAVMIL